MNIDQCVGSVEEALEITQEALNYDRDTTPLYSLQLLSRIVGILRDLGSNGRAPLGPHYYDIAQRCTETAHRYAKNAGDAQEEPELKELFYKVFRLLMTVTGDFSLLAFNNGGGPWPTDMPRVSK